MCFKTRSRSQQDRGKNASLFQTPLTITTRSRKTASLFQTPLTITNKIEKNCISVSRFVVYPIQCCQNRLKCYRNPNSIAETCSPVSNFALAWNRIVEHCVTVSKSAVDPQQDCEHSLWCFIFAVAPQQYCEISLW